MKKPEHRRRHRGNRSTAARRGAVLACFAILLGGVIAAARAQSSHSNDSPTASSSMEKALPSDPSQAPARLSKSFKGKLPITELSEDEAMLHAMNRLGYGPRPGDFEMVRQMGLEKWVERQLHPESIDDAPLDERLTRYPTLSMSSKKLLEGYPEPQQVAKKEGITKEEAQQERRDMARQAVAAVNPTGPNADAEKQLAKIQGPPRIVAELSMAKLDRAIYSDRQLEAVMENFWFNHFNVFAGKNEDRWLITSYVRDTIRPHAMGKFPDLLLATAKSPAMLVYLDNWLSVDPVAYQQYQAQEAARRAMHQARYGAPPPRTFPPPYNNPNAPMPSTAKKQDRGLNENYGREVMELHTLGVDGGYTQQDVIEMAKCLTGWTVHEPKKDPQFFFDEKFHAHVKKIVLGHKFDHNSVKDGEDALKMLANQPATAKFISTKLARHFVSDNPPPALIQRMTKTYLSSDGDIRAVMKTMIYSPEFWSREAFRSKVKTPFELAASTARTLNASAEVTLPLAQWVGRMGEPLFQAQPPTGYSDKAETWVNTGALLNRLNFSMAMAAGKVSGTHTDIAALLGPEAGNDPEMALSRALNLFLEGQVAASTRATLEQRLADPQVVQAKLDDPVKHVNEALLAGLVLGAPEFQRR
jgi:uncharacterized protein (DUF1800 family)